MYLLLIGWLYVVLMMAVADATHINGSVIGAILTFFLYGLLPISLVFYLMNRPSRRKQQKDAPPEQAQESAHTSTSPPDAGSHAPGGTEASAVAPVRKEQ